MDAISNDLEIIKQIEKEIGRELKELNEEAFDRQSKSYYNTEQGYLTDKSSRVIGLKIVLTSLPSLSLINKLSFLNRLILGNVSLKDASSLKELKGLTSLDLRSNNLTDVTFLKELKGLTYLELSGNNLTDVTFLKELKGLTFLGLSYNNLTDVTFLKELKGLTYLYLSYNNLTDVTFLKELKGLTSLYLSGNKKIKDFSFLKEFKGLTSLYLSRNNLTDVTFLKDMENLTYIDLDGNPIKEPPKEIISQGIESIRDYLKSLEGEKQLLKEVKVLLVGDGGAGKTSLLKQLKGETFDKNEPQTHGINIEDLPVTIGGSHAKIHIWDFGGQEIMHASHQFFLSKRSLYILVNDCRKDDKIEHWLKHIRSFGGNSPVLVVINKIDQNPSFDLNRQHLQEKYQNIRGFLRLSCATRKGMKEFTAEMLKEIETVEYMRTQWAKTWFHVKEALQNMKENYITYDRYFEICRQKQLNDESQQKTLLEYLHNLGVILHFEDFELKDYQVLEPKWVTEAVYKVINSETLAQKQGYLDKNMLDHILNKEAFDKDEYQASLKKTPYDRQEQKYIIALMKTFELCYSIDDKTLLVPDLLAVQEPQFVQEFDKEKALKFLYTFDFLPPGIIPRFIVKMNKDIKAEHLQWRTGVVLEDKDIGSTAVIKADKEAKKIFIYVSGEHKQKRDYFSVIRHTLDRLIDSFEELHVTELVPLPDNEDIAIEYKELLGYEKAGRDEYFIGKLARAYSVSKLLDGIESMETRKLRHSLDVPGHPHPPGATTIYNIIDNKPHFENRPEIDIKVTASAHAESIVNLEMDLPDLQSHFEDLKYLLEDQFPELTKRFGEVDKELYKVNTKSEKEALNRPLGKLGNFLRRLGDDKSDTSKFLKGTEKVLETAQKLGRTYDKFAQWIPGLPRIPDVFLGKK